MADEGDFYDDIDFADLEIISLKVQKTTCCRSYLLSKGRCYICPERIEFDPDKE